MSGQAPYGNQPRRSGGPLGMVFGALGTGVGAVAEYREHRKAQKLSRENSRQSDTTEAGSSTTPSQPVSRVASSSEAAPPAYSDAAHPTAERSISSGKPATDDKKAALAQYDEKDVHDDDSDDTDSLLDDEEDWELDEMLRSESNEPPSYLDSETAYGNTDQLVREVMEKQRPQSLSPNTPPFVRTPLPCPVILPQRRPGSKARGFVRAYAPLLGECGGIDQDTFMTFLENFYKSSQASPAFKVAILAATIAGFVPEMTAQIVSTVVQVGAGVGMEVQSRQRTNDFLEKMNEELFKPAGLFVMVVKYKSQAQVDASGNSLFARLGITSEVVNVNTNQSIAKYDRSLSDESAGSGSGSKSMSQRMQNLRLASGTTKGAIHLPEAAPLVFPDIDKAVIKDGPETFKDKAQDAKFFLGDYFDRRAQMKYARDDPTSSLIVPESERTFKSKLADPNHPMYNSGPIGFISGGYLAKDPNRRGDRRYDKQQRRIDKYERRMDGGRDLSRKKQRRYDAFMAQNDERFGYGPPGGFGGRPGYGYEPRRRRGPGGPIGLVGGLVSGALGAASGRSREYEDSYNAPAPHAPYGGSQEMRRSFDDRENAYGQRASYGSSAEAAEYGYGSGAGYGRQRPYPRGNRKQGGGGPLGMIGRMMKEDLLYLMVVNMPSEAELAEARQQLETAKNAK